MKNKLRLSAIKQVIKELGLEKLTQEQLINEVKNQEMKIRLGATKYSKVNIRTFVRWVLLKIAIDEFSEFGSTVSLHKSWNLAEYIPVIRLNLRSFPYEIMYDSGDLYVSKTIVTDEILSSEYYSKRFTYLQSLPNVSEYKYGEEIHNCEEFMRRQISSGNFLLSDDLCNILIQMCNYTESELENIVSFLVSYEAKRVKAGGVTYIQLNTLIAK